MSKNHNARSDSRKRPMAGLTQNDFVIASKEAAYSKLSKSETAQELDSVVSSILPFLKEHVRSYKERHEIIEECYRVAEIVLQKPIRTEEDRDSLPYLVNNLGKLSKAIPDKYVDNEKVFATLERHIGRFTKLLDVNGLGRVITGLSFARNGKPSKIFDKLGERFIQLANKGGIPDKDLSSILFGFAETKYQPTDDFFEAWDGVVQGLKEKKSSNGGDSLRADNVAQALYNLSLMKAQGLEVPEDMVEKWFDFAANTKDGSFDHRSWRQMYLTALVFDFPNPEQFRISGIAQTTSTTREQNYYQKHLQKCANSYMNKSESDIEIKIESEQLFELIDSAVDYKVTISGGAGANKETVFWVQYDGPHHYQQTENSREYDSSTKLQNMIIEPRLDKDERLMRIDYGEVRDRETKDINKASATHFHAKDTLNAMITMHRKNVLGLDDKSRINER